MIKPIKNNKINNFYNKKTNFIIEWSVIYNKDIINAQISFLYQLINKLIKIIESS